MSKLQKGYILSIILLALSTFLYFTSSNLEEMKQGHAKNENVTRVNGEKIEKVDTVSLSRIEDEKAYFDRNLPDYLPGRTGSNSVDTSYYKTSKFKGNKNFNLIRIYSKDANNNIVHLYRFVPIGEKIQ